MTSTTARFRRSSPSDERPAATKCVSRKPRKRYFGNCTAKRSASDAIQSSVHSGPSSYVATRKMGVATSLPAMARMRFTQYVPVCTLRSSCGSNATRYTALGVKKKLASAAEEGCGMGTFHSDTARPSHLAPASALAGAGRFTSCVCTSPRPRTLALVSMSYSDGRELAEQLTTTTLRCVHSLARTSTAPRYSRRAGHLKELPRRRR
mmetsp:Transcript_5584/g.14120  ORF Transcript_5584/g.14120 Transcript_5584/m.14120 type:complete len:207 (+) Transcript_5584:2565-3185(+)